MLVETTQSDTRNEIRRDDKKYNKAMCESRENRPNLYTTMLGMLRRQKEQPGQISHHAQDKSHAARNDIKRKHTEMVERVQERTRGRVAGRGRDR